MENKKRQVLLLIAVVCFGTALCGQTAFRKISDDQYVVNGLTYQLSIKNLNAKVVEAEAGLTDVVVPPTITVDQKTYDVWMIGDEAFKNCRQTLSSVKMNKVFVISEKAFKDCKKLKTVNLGEKLSSIFDSAFEGCESLTSIYLPADLDLINFPTEFKGCYRLNTINTDPNNKVFISEHGVVYAKGKYGDAVKYVPNGFYGPGNGLYMSPANVRSVMYGAFDGSSLVKVVFSPDLAEVEKNAFVDCPNLEEIHFWNDACKINPENFNNCPKLKALYFRKNGAEQKMTISEWKAKQKSLASVQTPEQLFRLGYDHYMGRNGKAKDYKKAAEYYRQAADQGHAGAQANLGLMLRDGQGVSVNLQESIMYFAKAAAQGNTTGQVNLAWMYDTGKGVSKDYKEAVKWYRKAAEQGDATAQYNLGLCYEQGKGVSKDMGQAKLWYAKAAAQGHRKAINKL